MKIHSDWRCLNCGWQTSAEYPLQLASQVMLSLDAQHAQASKSCKELILKVRY